MNTKNYSIKVHSGSRALVTIDKFEVPENKITFLFGESGIGKSILCKAIYGLLDPDDLHVSIDSGSYSDYCCNSYVKAIRKSSFFVFQEPSSHLNSLKRINEQLNEGSLAEAPEEKKILGYLWESGYDNHLEELLTVYPKPFRPSGGEKQRILLAMAFKKIGSYITGNLDSPTFFVFDEPTGSLDNAHRNRFLKMLFSCYAQKQFTAVVITHDYSIISEIYSNHKSLLPSVSFKELSRVTESSVKLNDFSAQEYLGWLHSARNSTPETAENVAVLNFESSFKIFDRNLSIYKDPQHTIPTNLKISSGTMAYVKAPSGVGKTTLAKIILGLYKAQTFSMNLCGERVTHESPRSIWSKTIWGKRAGMVFQHADEALDMEATVMETFKGLPLQKALDRSLIVSLLSSLFPKEMICEAFLDKKVKYLSGGQKQRVNLLRTLALKTNLIILDEPLNALDFESVKRVLQLLENLKQNGAALLMISHNEEIFEALVDQAHTYYLA